MDAVDLAPSNLTAETADGGVDLSWTAPVEDADSITGYAILRAVGEGEMATLAADTASTATTYTDAIATGGGGDLRLRGEGRPGPGEEPELEQGRSDPGRAPGHAREPGPDQPHLRYPDGRGGADVGRPARRLRFRDRLQGAAPPPQPG